MVQVSTRCLFNAHRLVVLFSTILKYSATRKEQHFHQDNRWKLELAFVINHALIPSTITPIQRALHWLNDSEIRPAAHVDFLSEVQLACVMEVFDKHSKVVAFMEMEAFFSKWPCWWMASFADKTYQIELHAHRQTRRLIHKYYSSGNMVVSHELSILIPWHLIVLYKCFAIEENCQRLCKFVTYSNGKHFLYS